jgi:hypothetical protein
MAKRDKQEFFVVEEGIPIPPKPSSRYWYGQAAKKVYPFEELRVGDSFLAPITKRPQAIKYAAKKFAERRGLPLKVEIRVLAEGVRCWRVK